MRAHVPRALLGLPAGGMEPVLARPVSGQSGFAGLLVNFLSGLAAGPAAYRVDDIPRLARIAQDLLTAFVAHHLDAEGGLPEESRTRALLLRVEAFVQQHLHDPELSPRAVAAAHHVSVSHLHRLFSARDTSLSTWIRRLRLERTRRDLRDAVQHDVPIHTIASRWGFKDHSSFTRSFTAAYGMSPRDYRHSDPGAAPRT